MPPKKKAAASAATPTSKAHKRQLSSASTPTSTITGTRSSKRIKEAASNTPAGVKVTPKKSKYFELDDSDDELQEDTQDADSASGYEEGTDVNTEADITESEEDEDEEVDDFGSEEDKKKRRKTGRKPTSNKRVNTNNSTSEAKNEKELWRPGVKTGLGPGKQVFIAKPKPRGDGGIKYKPDQIHPNTMLFLEDLKNNNDREWLKMHDPDYRQSWKDWESFVQSLTEKLSEIDETIPELPPKDLVFRIYRDVRFSSDPTPYKTHYSAAWSRTGRKGPYAAYYVQIKPKGSFIGCGLWMPEAQPLALLRRDVDRRPRKIRQVLMDPDIRKHILGNCPKDEKKAIKAFVNQNSENALKTKPKGFEADNPNIELLRLRNYTMGQKLTDDQVLAANGIDTIAKILGMMTPFVTYLNSVVMPDAEESSSGNEGEEDEGDDNNDSE